MDSMKISQTERQNRKMSGEEENEKNPKVKKQSAKNEARAASDSIYLTVRSSAVTLDKASGVKVGNVKTQLPDGYEGYIRRTAKCETNLGSDVLQPKADRWMAGRTARHLRQKTRISIMPGTGKGCIIRENGWTSK